MQLQSQCVLGLSHSCPLDGVGLISGDRGACEEPHDGDVPASGNIGNWRDLSNVCEVDGAAHFVGTLMPDGSWPLSIVEGSECSHAS